MKEFSDNLHRIYKSSIEAFIDSIDISDYSMVVDINMFCMYSALFLWMKTGVSEESCLEGLDCIYVNEEDKIKYDIEQMRYMIKDMHITLDSGEDDGDYDIPEFYTKLINYDLSKNTTHSKAFAEGLKLILISCALIDGLFENSEREIVDKYCEKLISEADRCGVGYFFESVDTYDYVNSSNYIRVKKDSSKNSENNNVVGIENSTIKNEDKIEKQKNENSKSDPGVDSESLDNKLNKLIGLDRVKEEVSSLRNLVKVQQLRKEQNLPVTTVSYHLVFTGNPGTGKTTVARIIARIFKDLGVLSSGHLVEVKRNDLIAGYAGQTAIKTAEVVNRAKGGILFIDEAYSLVDEEGGYGQEAIDTLLKEMEDNRDDLVVIAAGYDDLMKDFIDSNPGLKSRFNKYIHFEDYSVDELVKIFDLFCDDNKYIVDDAVNESVKEYFEDINEKKSKNFGNARDVRNFFEDVITKQADRVAKINQATIDDLMLIKVEDLGVKTKSDHKTLEEAIEELNKLVGLNEVKKEVSSLVDYMQVYKARKEKGLPTPNISLHLVFSGNPGTGKTTVARCIADIYRAIGLLSEGQLVETDRAGLVAGYIGQTAEKTKKIIDRALGGVLFIDEAYTLARGGSDDYGQEAIDTLLKEMEDNRDNLSVIIAGYDDLIDEFIDSNPGLKSRFNRYIHFADYSTAELMEIFKGMCSDNKYSLTETAEYVLGEFFNHLKGNDIGNGRGVRNLFEKAVKEQASRLAKLGIGNGNVGELTEEDILNACTGIVNE